MKVVFNNTHGAFELSERALDRLNELKLCILDSRSDDISRHDPRLVQVVEELGDAASRYPGELSIEEIEGYCYWIQESEGMECVMTPKDIPWTIVIEE
jgi:hypothetical protein|tara:strand:+ start:2357 stop:2650 length:294 start_codon:yes stop_codon:yes gene_type:complete